MVKTMINEGPWFSESSIKHIKLASTLLKTFLTSEYVKIERWSSRRYKRGTLNLV